MIATTIHSPLLLAHLLSISKITLDENEEKDICFVFKDKKTKSRITILFNSTEYCLKRNLKLYDDLDITVVAKNILELLNV